MNDLHPFNYISLFTGGGGLDLGLHRAVLNARCVANVEVEAFARAVLAARMEDRSLDSAPCYADIISFNGTLFHGLVDCVIGGSPCQDMSLAGKRAGLEGARSGLFFEMCRIIGECQPQYVFFENVLGAKKYLPQIFAEFERLGYAGKATVVRASDVGAPHQRARIFILARRVEDTDRDGRSVGMGNTTGPRLQRRGRGDIQRGESQSGCVELADPQQQQQLRVEPGRSGWEDWSDSSEPPYVGSAVADDDDGREGERGRWVLDGLGPPRWHDADGRSSEELADAIGGGGSEAQRRYGIRGRESNAHQSRPTEWPPGPDGDWSGIDQRFFPAQPRVRLLADGVLRRVGDTWADQLRLYGNACVPAQAAAAFRFLYAAITAETPTQLSPNAALTRSTSGA